MRAAIRRRFRAHTWRGIRCGAVLGSTVPAAVALTSNVEATAASLVAVPAVAALVGWAMERDADRRTRQPAVMASATAPSHAGR